MDELDLEERADKFGDELLVDENNDDVWKDEEDIDFITFGGDRMFGKWICLFGNNEAGGDCMAGGVIGCVDDI